MPRPDSPFADLFVLELANNHWGSVERGKRIIKEHARVVRSHKVRAAIKLQFRDVPTFVHKDFRESKERYVDKTLRTELSKQELGDLVDCVRAHNLVTMATPFDEVSVGWCEEFDLDVIKLASSDVNDWPLIERIAETRKPVIASSGGASEVDLDNLVLFFENRNIPLAINHCVSLYPTEDDQLELNEIDYLTRRHGNHVIGLSTHEYRDWQASMFISYAKGARTWERHIDIEDGTQVVSPYCSTPKDLAIWFDAYHKAREMCGSGGFGRRVIRHDEADYLWRLVRGVYARRELPEGHVITHDNFTDDFYLAIPLQPNQTSVRDIVTGLVINRAIGANEPLMAADIEPLGSEYEHVGATSQNHRGKPQ